MQRSDSRMQRQFKPQKSDNKFKLADELLLWTTATSNHLPQSMLNPLTQDSVPITLCESFPVCSHASMRARVDLSGTALRVIEEALARSRAGAFQPGEDVRLALAVLVKLNITETWQAREFWKELRSDETDDGAGMIGYKRFTLLNGIADAMYYRAGQMPPARFSQNAASKTGAQSSV